MPFQIEVRPRSIDDRTFVAFYQVEAATESAAIVEAMRRFGEQNQDKDVSTYKFTIAR